MKATNHTPRAAFTAEFITTVDTLDEETPKFLRIICPECRKPRYMDLVSGKFQGQILGVVDNNLFRVDLLIRCRNCGMKYVSLLEMEHYRRYMDGQSKSKSD